MTTTYTLRNMTRDEILAAAAEVEQQVAAADEAIALLGKDPTASATIATAGGSQSFTRATLSDLIRVRDHLRLRYAKLLNLLAPRRRRGPRITRTVTRFR